MKIQKLTRGSSKKFFDGLTINDVFTYSSSFNLDEVKFLCKKNGIDIEYCNPDDPAYKVFGCFTCRVVAKAGVIDEQPVSTEKSKYTIKLNETQLRIALEALDLYSRLLCGQTTEAANFLRWHTISSGSEINQEAAEAAGVLLKDAFFGNTEISSTNASYGIRSDKAPKEAKVAYDMIQVARYVRAWSKNPEGGIQVDFHTPWKCGNEEFISVTKDDE